MLRAGRGKAPRHAAIVSSFDEAALAAMADRLLPDWPRWLNSTTSARTPSRRPPGLGCRAVAVQWRAISASAFKAARAAGLEVAAWTLTRPPSVERLAKLGVVAVCVEGAALDG